MSPSKSRSWSRRAALGLPLLGGGCYTAQLDLDVAGVFACSDDEDDACPASLVCVNARCEDPELAPTVAVLAPEDEQALRRDDVLTPSPGMPPGSPIELVARIRGSLTLVSASAGADPIFGEGHVRVFVDGEEQGVVDAGSIDASTEVPIFVPPVAGPHRIVLQAYRNDGEPYDNPEATAVRLFWLEDAAFPRPFVAIKSPWPGAVFDVEDQLLEIEVATLHFELTDPGGAPTEGRGHAHLHHAAPRPFPDCVADEGCDDGYLGVAGRTAIGELPLPAAPAGRETLAAVLRNGDHTPYAFPFACDPSPPLGLCVPVFDEIEIVRIDDDD